MQPTENALQAHTTTKAGETDINRMTRARRGAPWESAGRVTLTGPWPLSVRRVDVDSNPVGLVWFESGSWRWSPWAPDVRYAMSRPASSRDAAVLAALRLKAGVLRLDLPARAEPSGRSRPGTR